VNTTRLDNLAPPAGLIVERHGSLGVGHLRPILAERGFGLALGPHARQRLLRRRYDEARAA
jgi:hypothetical protein